MEDDRNCLASILDAAYSFDAGIQEMVNGCTKIKDDELRTKLKNSIGNVMKEITLGIVFPITTRFPDLDRDK